MAHKHCKHCGSKNEYVGKEPKFCSHCGKSLGSMPSHVVKASIPQKKSVARLADDETDVDYIPNITKLQYEVSPYEKVTFKVEELFNLEDNGEKER